MKNKLIYFLAKYGNDFFHKLPKYKTATYKDGQYVSIFKVDLKTLRVLCNPDARPEWVDLFDLDNFVL